MRTFSIGFDHQGFDELPHARQIAEQFGTIHEEFQVRADAVEIVPKIVRHYGEPFADSSAIPSFYLVRAHPPPRHRGAQWRRRRRVLRRLHALCRQRARRTAGPDARAPCAAQSPGRRAQLPAGGQVGSLQNKARRFAGTLALDGPGALRELHVVVRSAPSAASSTRPRSRPGRARRRAGHRRIVGGRIRRDRRRQDARGRRQDLPGRRSDREDRHRDHGLRP